MTNRGNAAREQPAEAADRRADAFSNAFWMVGEISLKFQSTMEARVWK